MRPPRLILLCAFTFVALPSCRSGNQENSDTPTEPHPSLEFDPQIVSPKVENGTAYDMGSVSLEGYDAVAVAESARVTQEGDGQQLQLFMAKRLSFGGHPPEPIRLRYVRKNMGCATKPDGRTLMITAFGGFDTKEGGAYMDLLVIVPKGVRVERRAMPPPPTANATAGGQWYLTKPREVKVGYWYGPASPPDGWVAVPDVPDTDRRAKQ
jgi:hypothetical protein